MAKKVKKQELGLGIRALLGNDKQSSADKAEVVQQLSSSVLEIPLDEIEVNPYQPRKEFDAEALEQLAASLKTHGLIQPITVRRLANKQYQLISGERRLRASKKAGLESVPAYIRIADDQAMMEMALIENIQRENLNPFEVAVTYQRLLEEFELTHDRLAERVHKGRTTITNHLSLLRMPPEILQGIKEKGISLGHAKALNGVQPLEAQLDLYRQVVSKELSVRETEKLAKLYKLGKSNGKSSTPKMEDGHRQIESEFKAFFGSKKVQLKLKGKGGQIVIPFSDTEELNDLFDRIGD